MKPLSLLALFALAACGPAPSSPPATPPPDAAAPDTPYPDASYPDNPSTDTPYPDNPSTDNPSPDLPSTDTPSPDLPSTDTPSPDAVALPCGPNYACPDGHRCVGLSDLRCVRTAALGEPCRNGGPDPIYCPNSATCEPVDGVSRCVNIGTRDGLCQNSSSCLAPCAAGLGCDPSFHCREGLAPGSLCGGPGDFCNVGATCMNLNGTARCVADGTDGGLCRYDRSCAAGLGCRGANVGGCSRESYRCTSTLALWDTCTPTGTPCPAGTTCAMSADALRCLPISDGTVGTRCRTDAPHCNDGLVCRNGWTCARLATRGASCEPTGGSVVCSEGDTCTTEHRADSGRCVAPGTAPGADCRSTGSPCDGALQCSDFSRYRRTCRVVAEVGDPCDLGAIQTLCPGSSRCLPVTVSATGAAVAACVVATPEVEPNDRAAPAHAPLTRSTLIAASLSVDDREDCYRLTVPAGGALFVESTISLGVSLFRSSGVELGRWTMTATSWGGPLGGTARLDPAAIAALRELPADDYLLCTRETATPSPRNGPARHILALAILPRSW